MIINMGSAFVAGYTLTINTTAGATIVATKNGGAHTAVANSAGIAILENLSSGTWTITAEIGNLTATKTVDVYSDEYITLILNTIPEFTFESDTGIAGKYAIYDHLDNDITENPETNGDWKIKFFESGKLVFQRLNSAVYGIDVFCVGGGGGGAGGVQPNDSEKYSGGGGGGGYTTTRPNVEVIKDKLYEITVGGGGPAVGYYSAHQQAGTTEAFGVKASGGYSGASSGGGDGGSGGGSSGFYGEAGGTDGEPGLSYSLPNYPGGTGQGNPPGTKEFGEEDGTLYSTGGTGGGWVGTTYDGANGGANTGDGGDGASGNGGSGGSGVVVIRNKR